MTQYILIETEPTITHLVVLPTDDVDVLSTGQVEALTVTDTIPGVRLYQCIGHDGTVSYKTVMGTPFNLAGGSSVVDANPPIPLWDAPEVPVVNAAPRILSKLDYMNLFTEDELDALWAAAITTVRAQVWMKKFDLRDVFDLDDPRTLYDLQILEGVGILVPGRALQMVGAR